MMMYKLETESMYLADSPNIKGLLHGYEWGLRFGGLELRFG